MRKIDTNQIQWPKAVYWTKQWNPWIGCQRVSPACEHCYAATIARRFKLSFTPHRTKQKMPKTGVVFCGNMTDCFGDWVSESDLDSFFSQMWKRDVRRGSEEPNQAHYLWLTKRVARMVHYLQSSRNTHGDAGFFGMTAENQELYNLRLAFFREAFGRGRKGWLSAEPLIGPIDLGLGCIPREDCPFGWVVVGCESGPKRRPCKMEWVEDIVRQSQEHHTPVFVKQLDLNGKCVTDINQFPANLRIRQVPWSNKENT